jgi:hypothetical protein
MTALWLLASPTLYFFTSLCVLWLLVGLPVCLVGHYVGEVNYGGRP